MKSDITKAVDLPNSLSEIRKLLAFIAPALGAVITAFVKDGVVSPALLVAAALAIVLGVPAVFHPSNPFVKGLLAFLTGLLQALTLIVANAAGWADVTYNDWIVVVGTAIGAVLAIYVPNKPAEAPDTSVAIVPESSSETSTVVVDGSTRV